MPHIDRSLQPHQPVFGARLPLGRGHSFEHGIFFRPKEIPEVWFALSCELTILLAAGELVLPSWRGGLGRHYSIQYRVQFNFCPYRYSIVPAVFSTDMQYYLFHIKYSCRSLFLRFFFFFQFCPLGQLSNCDRSISTYVWIIDQWKRNKRRFVLLDIKSFYAMIGPLTISQICIFENMKYPHLSCSPGMPSLPLILQG